MDPTVAFMMSRCSERKIAGSISAMSPSEWAIYLLEQGFNTESIRMLTDPTPPMGMQYRLILQALSDIGRTELLNFHSLRAAYEAESIADFFAGTIDGWTLIKRGAELFYDDQADGPGRDFWIWVGEDASGHGQELYGRFTGGDVDHILRRELRKSNRPLPADVKPIRRKK